jgi:hypothetical protein
MGFAGRRSYVEPPPPFPKSLLRRAGTLGYDAANRERRVVIGAELREFIEGAVMIVIGTHDGAGVAGIGRGCGVIADTDGRHLDVGVSAWLWPDSVGNLASHGEIALTFVRASDYVTFQLKGEARLVPVQQAHRDCVRDYGVKIRAALVALGVQPGQVEAWTTGRDLRVARVEVREAFVQTPGPKAGARLP